MGLTIHYTLSCDHPARSPKPLQLVEAVRQLALDMPFQSVGTVYDLRGKQCDFEARRDELQNSPDGDGNLFWMLIQASKTVNCPWNKAVSIRVNPSRMVAFSIDPGEGCESMNVGLCLYPETIDWDYKAQDDRRFQIEVPGQFRPDFNWRKFDRYRGKDGVPHTSFEAVPRKVPTNLPGWRWGSFCKTEYAMEAGAANFLRCHVGIVNLLERAAKIPGLRVVLDDEGHYGPGTYSKDYEEAKAAGREPTYRRYKGTYDPNDLLRQVQESGENIVALFGVLSEVMGAGVAVESPIKSRPDFEVLEFKGRRRSEQLLQALAQQIKAAVV